MQEIGRLEKQALNELLAAQLLLEKREAETQQLRVQVQNLTSSAARALNGLSGRPVVYKFRKADWIVEKIGAQGLTVTRAQSVSSAV